MFQDQTTRTVLQVLQVPQSQVGRPSVSDLCAKKTAKQNDTYVLLRPFMSIKHRIAQ